MTDRLTALDSTFLELEELDEGALMSIGGVMVFDPLPDGGAPSVTDVQANLAARLGELPRCSQRLSSTRTGSFSWPHWEPDEQFDIRNHLTRAALPAPGSDAQLWDWTADLFSHRLDRTRPLWETVLVEGLEHDRWALGHKTHHCLVDGVGSVDVVRLLLDEEPNGSRPRWYSAGEPSSSPRLRLPHPPEAIVQATQRSGRAAGAGIHAALHPRDLRDTSGQLALGNCVTSLFVDLPVAERDPRVRLGEISASTLRLKSSSAPQGATTLIDLAALGPPVVQHAALARTIFATRLFNVTITNVPGPEKPLYAFGSLMRELHPFVPLAADHSVGIAIFSYNGLVTFGISADCESTPDLDVLAYGIEDGLQELRELVPELDKTPQETRT